MGTHGPTTGLVVKRQPRTGAQFACSAQYWRRQLSTKESVEPQSFEPDMDLLDESWNGLSFTSRRSM